MGSGFTRRGFTLAELLVGLAVTSIVMVATVAIFLGVQRSYQAETESKQLTESGRGALLFLERTVALAGYGIDPRLAFDVAGTRARDNQDVQGVTFTPSQPAMTGRANTIVTDELSFRYRDPAYLRAGRLDTGNTQLTVDSPFGVALPSGKLMMVGCRGGGDVAYVRTQATAAAGASSVAVANAGAPFTANSNPCLRGTGVNTPWVFMVHEHRVRIVNLAGRPWLVSFRSFDASITDLSGDTFDPIAPDVESFHVAFGMNRARVGLACCQTAPDATGNSNWIIGDAAGETFFAQPASVLGTEPDYRTGYDRPQRYALHPANVRSVHLAFVFRSSRPAPARQNLSTGNIFNSAMATPARDGFLRSMLHTAISTPNLMSRTGFVPALRSSADTRDLNSWGG